MSQSYAHSLDKERNTYCHASCVSVCVCVYVEYKLVQGWQQSVPLCGYICLYPSFSIMLPFGDNLLAVSALLI